LIVFTPRAAQQVRALRQHFEERERPEATRNLITALDSAWLTITTNPAAGLPAPRPYPQLARPGRAWVHAGRYWIAYRTRPPAAIVAVVYDAADIPRRL
jgi:plasmid stabilization system protein ParE